MLQGVVGRFSTDVQDLGMEYSKNTSIPKRVCICTCFGGADHDVIACSWINRVLILLDIICGGVDTKHLGQVHPIIKNKDIPVIGVGVILFISIIIKFEQVAQQVIF